MENYASYNSRNIFEYFTPTRALFLCIDALDFKDTKGAPTPRLKVRCVNHNDNMSEGNRITEEVSVYIPISRFLLLAHDVLSGVTSKKKREAATKGAEGQYATYFEYYGGNKNGAITSTKLALVNGKGENASFALLATSGPGRLTPQGGIIPLGKTDDKSANHTQLLSVFINLPDDKLKEFCLIGKAYAEQYIALDLQDRLQVVRKHRQAYRAQQEQEYLSEHGYRGGAGNA